VGFFLTPPPTLVPSSESDFCFFPMLIVKDSENVCSTLGLGRVDLLGSLELVRVELLRS